VVIVYTEREPKKNRNHETENRCPGCGSSNLYHDRSTGDVICTGCGVVVYSRTMDNSHEWRAFTSDEEKMRSRTGPFRKPYETPASMLTLIGSRWENTDAAGRQLSLQRRSEIYRLRKWQIRNRVHSSIERNLNHAYSEMDILCSQMSLPQIIIDEAKRIYKLCVMKLRYSVKSKYVPASVYAAARMNDSPLILEELVDNCGEVVPPSVIERKLAGDYTYKNANEKEKKEKREKEVRRQATNAVSAAYRRIRTTLELNPPLQSPECYIPRFVSEIYKDKDSTTRADIERIAIKKLQVARKENRKLVEGRGPRGVAAAVVYIVGILTGNRMKQADVARYTHITEVTLRSRYKEMVEVLGITTLDDKDSVYEY